MSGLDSVDWSPFLKRRMTGFFTRAGIQAICSRVAFHSLADDTECVHRTLEVGRFSNMALLARPSIVSSPSALGTGLAIFQTQSVVNETSLTGFHRS